MRVIEIGESFGLDGLRRAERPEPEPGRGQVLVRMKAASLNYRDLLTIEGKYNPRQPLPLIPCSDGVGEVTAVGDGVDRVEVGERVCPIFAQRWISGRPTPDRLRSTLGGPLDGTLAESMVVDQQGLVRVPEHLTDEEAACLPCAAVTAWSALVTHGSVTAGDTVLILGTGGVAMFALQFAALLGARIIVTSSSDEKLERARELGAWHGINYREDPAWGKTVRRLTDGAGVDHIVEVAGAGSLEQSLRAIRFGGDISLIGVLSGGASDINIVPILMQQVRVQGILVGHRDSFEAMNRAIAAHELRPVIDSVYGFDRVREAIEHMAEGRHLGKICVRIREGR